MHPRKKAGIREFGLVMGQEPQIPRYASFAAADGWKENPIRRDMRPTFPSLLEITRLSEEYDLERIIPVIGRNSQVYLGRPKGPVAKGPKPATIFARMITHTLKMVSQDDDSWEAWPENLLLAAVDEVERARLNPKVGPQPNSNIFAHFMTNLDMDPAEVDRRFEQFMNSFVSKYGGRLQKSKVDEIVLKVGIGKGSTRTNTLRLTASSITGEYLRTSGLLEKQDPITGSPAQWFDIQSGEERKLDTSASKSRMQLRRAVARSAGSTYAPEFLGMMKVDIISRWKDYKASGGTRKVPKTLLASKELVLSKDGKLVESDRLPGQNDIGMVAWRITMQTPEYPEGRDIVLIANDVTFQAGSFGVAEDVHFQLASEYARVRGLPRIHISCNSGARVGLAEELKPFVKAKWVDDEDPSKGFKYLYLEEADYKRFGEGVVLAREEKVGSDKHYVLEAIIGEGLKSTAGGIGVENLKGSGLIAGETARAYNEVFTLSYVTGRSVGIGAYLNRLGQRVIQMVNGPMILTGFGALNKLLGKKVYTSQDQLGGPQVMVPNGVTHKLVQSDSEGVAAILNWLSFVPKDAKSCPSIMEPLDPVDRDVTFVPSKRPYDPRHMLAGTTTPEGARLTGFFDQGTFEDL